MNQIVEKWSEFFILGFVKVTPILVALLFLFVGFYTYVTTDLGNNAFELPFPMW